MFGNKRRKEEAELRLQDEARAWQAAMWRWSEMHPGQPVMEAHLDERSSAYVWHGPMPARIQGDAE